MSASVHKAHAYDACGTHRYTPPPRTAKHPPHANLTRLVSVFYESDAFFSPENNVYFIRVDGNIVRTRCCQC